MITYAENRIYRDLDFLFTSISTTAYGYDCREQDNNGPAGTFVVPEQINLITPAGTSNPNVGTRVPLLPTTKEFLDAVYGSGVFLSGQFQNISARLVTLHFWLGLTQMQIIAVR
jgi:hypothetical protein